MKAKKEAIPIVIEDDIDLTPVRKSGSLSPFLGALKTLRPGQSFLYDVGPYERLTISVFKQLLEVDLICRKEGELFRVHRVK